MIPFRLVNCKGNTTHFGLGHFCSPWVLENLTHSLPRKINTLGKKEHHLPEDPKMPFFIGVSTPFVNFVCCVVTLEKSVPQEGPFAKRVIRMIQDELTFLNSQLGASQAFTASHFGTIALKRIIWSRNQQFSDGWVMDPLQPRQRVEDALSLEEVDMAGFWMSFPSFLFKEKHINTVAQWAVICCRTLWSVNLFDILVSNVISASSSSKVGSVYVSWNFIMTSYIQNPTLYY